ncbi:DoxX family protein [Nocardia sp. BMG111209]|uniref:DoxX family protein n=1 Tax=Nocardia sp. BMG111209 TaxID=1160137 RepID=UPI00036FD2BF|nr:DoxX family protein [Nocardia sp. BMG111209]
MLRRIAHPMLAADSIVGGVDALLDPEPRVRAVADLVQRGEKSLPPKVAAYLPGDATRVVRINAVVRISGGVLLAMGRMPRLSVILLAVTAVPTAVSEHDFWNEQDRDRRGAKRAGFLKQVSLFGGLLIASTDRAGKPSLTWRGRRAAARLKGNTAPWREHLAEAAELATERGPELGAALLHRGERLAEAARSGGENLAGTTHDLGVRAGSVAADRAGYLLDTTRDRGGDLLDTARDRGGDLFGSARDRGGDLLETTRDRGGDLLGTARDRSGDLLDTARDRGGDLLDTVRDRGGDLLDTARDRGGDLIDTARERGGDLLGSARDRGGRLTGAARDAVGRAR